MSDVSPRTKCESAAKRCSALDHHTKPFEHGSRWRGLVVLTVCNRINRKGVEDGPGCDFVDRIRGIAAFRSDERGVSLSLLQFCPFCGGPLRGQSAEEAASIHFGSRKRKARES